MSEGWTTCQRCLKALPPWLIGHRLCDQCKADAYSGSWVPLAPAVPPLSKPKPDEEP